MAITYSSSTRTITGTSFDDYIYAQNFYTEDPLNRYKGLTIKAGAGNDFIFDSKGSDIITGGSGNNTIEFQKNSGWENVINLTKGENLFIIDAVSATDYFYYWTPNINLWGNDITVYLYSESSETCSFILRNFAKSDITQSVILQNNIETIDFKNLMYNVYLDSTKYNGTYLNEYINNDDLIVGNKVINTKGGNDKIRAGEGNDTITGGAGNNTIIYYNGDGNDTIKLTKGENLTISLEDLSRDDVHISINKNNLLIQYIDEFSQIETITLKDFAKKDIVGTDGSVYITFNGGSTSGIYGEDYIDLKNDTNLYQYTEFSATKRSYTGTWLNENIDASYIYLPNDKGVTIKSGAGNDNIIGSDYNDTITGGTGNNVFTYFNGDGNDTINLTKDENLTINLENINMEDISLQVSKGNLLIQYIDTNSITRIITLKNFAKKDVVGTDGSVFLQFNSIRDGEEAQKINLKNILLNNSDFYNTKRSFTGTWLDENIDASELLNSNLTDKKGVTINSKSGDDTIYGSDYNDTLKGDVGDDEIYSNGGDDKIYGGIGNNYLHFNSGDGSDTIYSTVGGNDSLIFKNTLLEDLTFTQEKNNLIIKGYGTEKDSVTINNYFKGNSSVNKLFTKDFEMFLADAIKEESAPEIDNEHSGLIDGKHIVGSNGNDRLYGTENDDIIHGKLGADKIYGKGGDDSIDAFIDAYIEGGDGDDYIEVDKGFSTIKGDDGNDYIHAGGFDNEIYGGAGLDYIYSNGASFIDAGEDNDEISISGNIREASEVYGGKGDDIFKIYCKYSYFYGGNNDENTSSGNDSFELGIDSAYNKIYMEDGDNKIDIYGSYNEIYANDGNNYVKINSSYYSSNNIVSLGNGNNTFDFWNCKGNNNILKSGSGADTVTIEHMSNTNISNNNKIYTGDGNDIFNVGDYGTFGYELLGEAGNDIYNIFFNSSSYITNVVVNDSSGNDSIIFTGGYTNSATKNNLSMYINIKSDESYDSNLFIFNGDNNKIKITNYLGDGKIETVQSSDGYKVDLSTIETIAEQVASWLTTNNFDSIQDVINTGSSEQIATVTDYFNTAWVSP